METEGRALSPREKGIHGMMSKKVDCVALAGFSVDLATLRVRYMGYR